MLYWFQDLTIFGTCLVNDPRVYSCKVSFIIIDPVMKIKHCVILPMPHKLEMNESHCFSLKVVIQVPVSLNRK